MHAQLSERDLAEVERSAEEARKIVFRAQEHAEIQRYLNPTESSPYPLEYSFYLLGNVRGKTVSTLVAAAGKVSFR